MKKKTAIWLTIVSACFILLAAPGGAATQSTAAAPDKVPAPADLTLALTSAAPPRPNGDFVVSVELQGRWREIGRLSCDRFLRERRLDLAPWLPKAQKARLRIRQAGGGASHLDAVLLGGRAPLAASAGILKKISRRDNDLASSAGQSIDLTFAAGSGRELSLTGRIESTVIGTEPLQFPEANTFRVPSVSSSFYTYRLGSAPPPRQRAGSRAWLAEVGRRQPLFAVLAPTGSGHPAGYTYGWVSNDRRNLYVTIDFTLDNTYDGAKDYAKVYARCDGRLREFKVSVPERRWGRAHFTYTDKVAYQHKVYDFIIPLAELPGVAAGGDLDLCFAAYGTAVASAPLGVNLAHDPELNRYLMVFCLSNGPSVDVMGQFVGAGGDDIGAPFVIAGNVAVHELWPIAAFDPVNRRYLVAWNENANFEFQIRGRMLGADGAPAGAPFQVLSTVYYLTWKAVAFDHVNQRYLLVWDEMGKGHSAIRGQLRDRDGAIVPGGGPFIDISDSGVGRDPDVAFDGRSEMFLVVWDESIAGGVVGVPWTLFARPIVGRLVASSGAPVGDVFDVTPGTDFHGQPTVANDKISHRFLVAWVQAAAAPLSGPDGSDRGQAGEMEALPGENLFVAGQLLSDQGELIGGLREIATASRDHIFPQLAFDPVHGRYLAVFQAVTALPTVADRRRESAAPVPFGASLQGQFLSPVGLPLATSPWENFPIGATATLGQPPALAVDPDCGRFLAAWALPMNPSAERAVVGGPCAELPTVTTAPVEAVTTTGATSGGTVISDGGAQVTSRGVCWNTSGLPTLANAHSSDGSGSGSFASHLSGLLPGVSYRVRAYATNRIGTAYGNEVTFTTARWVVTFLADPGGTLSGQTPQYVANGGSCTPVQAIAQPGFFFRRWEGSNASSSLDDPLTVTNVNSDLAFTARFGSLGISAKRLIEHAWIIRAEYAEIELTVGGLADSGAAKFRLMRQVGGGDPEPLQEIAAGELKDGRTTFTSLPLDKGRSYTFRVEALDSAGALLGFSASVTI